MILFLFCHKFCAEFLTTRHHHLGERQSFLTACDLLFIFTSRYLDQNIHTAQPTIFVVVHLEIVKNVLRAHFRRCLNTPNFHVNTRLAALVQQLQKGFATQRKHTLDN